MFWIFALNMDVRNDLETHLKAVARDGAQVIIGALFGLPTQSSDDGPIANLPAPTTTLPRAKPLPQPKPPTKWERFAAAKGIQKTKRDRREWDEEKQEWVNRWGWKGKNKGKEEQWIHEVPDNARKFALWMVLYYILTKSMKRTTTTPQLRLVRSEKPE